MSLVHRITMFKIKGAEAQRQALAAYDKLAANNQKDGKPYIVYMCAGLTDPNDPRHKGYTVIAQSKFKTLEDMKFYDESCEAHNELKMAVKSLADEAPMTVWFEGAPLVDKTHDKTHL